MRDGDVVWHRLEDQVDPAHTALVVVDMQNDFVHPDGWVAQQQMGGYLDSSGVASAVARTGELLDAARRADLLVVHIRMIGDLAYLSPAMVAQYRRMQGEGRPGCVLQGTWGADVHDSLRPDPARGEVVVDKHRYSAFAGTRLDLVLRSHGIATVVMTGVATSGCVESTTRDAFFADYHTVTAEDCVADYDAERHRASLRKMDISFGYVVPSPEIAGVWAVRGPRRPSALVAHEERGR